LTKLTNIPLSMYGIFSVLSYMLNGCAYMLYFINFCAWLLNDTPQLYTLVENNEVIMLNKNYKYKKKHLNLDGLYFDLEQYFWGIIHFEVLCKSLKKIYSQPPNYPYNSKKKCTILNWDEHNHPCYRPHHLWTCSILILMISIHGFSYMWLLN
jgi:hypothetical protein